MSATTSQPEAAHKDPCTAWGLADLAVRLAMLQGRSEPDFEGAKACIGSANASLLDIRNESEELKRRFEKMVEDSQKFKPSSPTPKEQAINAVLKKFGDVYQLNYPITETVFMRTVMGSSGKSKARRQAVLRKAYGHYLESVGVSNPKHEEVDQFLTELFPIKNQKMFVKVLSAIAPFVPTGKRATKVQYRDKKTGRAKKRCESVKSSKTKKVEDGKEVA